MEFVATNKQPRVAPYLQCRVWLTRRGDHKDIDERQQLLKLATSAPGRLAMIIRHIRTALAF